MKLTFLRQGGDAELRLAFTRSDALPRLGAMVALLAVPAAVLLWGWRRRKSSSR